MARLRAAILGTGLIATKKHIPAFLRLKNKVELIALCDVNTQVAEQVAKTYGIRRVYGSLSDLLAGEKPDLVDICTPPRTHARLAMEAIHNGCHVLVEKPMATSLSECDAIVQGAKESGVKVCVGHSDLFYSSFMRARELVAEGKIGEFRGMRILLSTPTDYMTSRPDHWAHKLPGGVFGESGPHVVYMTLAFIPSIRQVQVQAKKALEYPWSQFEDFRIDLVGEKAISSIGLVYSTNQWMAQVDILGSEGSLLVDLQGLVVIKYNRPNLTTRHVGWSLLSHSFQILGGTAANVARLATGRLRSTHHILLDRFLDSILSGGSSPVPAEQGREAVRVMDLIVEQLDRKGTSAVRLDAIAR
jgi:predicted dehydrogenase